MTTQQLFLQALEAGLRGRTISPVEGDREMWRELFALAQSQSVLPLILEAVYPAGPDPEALTQYRPLAMRQMGEQIRKTQEFLELYDELTRKGQKVVVVKGIHLRRLYPQPDSRPSSDEDLWAGEGYLGCHEAMVAWGMVPSNPQADPGETGEMAYGRRGSPLYVELHRDLFPAEGPGDGAWEELFAGAWERAVTQEIQGRQIWTLDPTDHISYLIFHSYKHFLHSGFGLRQVCDLIRYGEVFREQICWMEVLERCRRFRAERFAGAMLEIGRRYLGFSPEGLPEAWQEVFMDPEPLLADLLGAGTFGDSSMSRRHSANITLSAFRGEKNGLVASLFPRREALTGRYPYLRQYPWLLPWAWLCRGASYARRGGGENRATQSLEIGRERVSLMRYYGILD